MARGINAESENKELFENFPEVYMTTDKKDSFGGALSRKEHCNIIRESLLGRMTCGVHMNRKSDSINYKFLDKDVCETKIKK